MNDDTVSKEKSIIVQGNSLVIVVTDICREMGLIKGDSVNVTFKDPKKRGR